MSRSFKVFKKRKEIFFNGRNITSCSNSTLEADVINIEIKPGIKNYFAKERIVPNSNESFSLFQENIGIINIIMNLIVLSFVFMNDVWCKKCDSGVDMQVLKNNTGLAVSFVLKCCICPCREKFSSLDYHEGNPNGNCKYQL
ncbi:uncharacterized protein NPIL_101721 [Nephila pilipes]|uniref:Uncharacterized protein n=1 Tax=Nephila pilipes TaxID=299642 RepID=A0A8X6UEM3_NEPPI|nr:uncharacterized protein NPIL_101721 [Nephila pilipes]